MDGEALDIHQATDLLASKSLELAQPEQEQPAEVKAPEPDAPEVEHEESLPEPEGGEGEVEPEEANPEPEEEVKAEQPSIDAPHFWSAEEKAAFARLTPDVQQIVLAKDKAAQALVTKAQQERAEAVKAAEAARANVQAIDQVLDQARQRFDRWKGYDWAKVASEDPDRYVRDKAQYDTELQAAQQLYQAKQHAEAQQQRQFYAEQEAKLKEIAPELADPEKGVQKRQELAQWLIEQGADPDDLVNITAWQAKVAYDAMRMSQVAKSAPQATKPPAPKPVRPAASPANANPLKKQLDAAQKELASTGSLDAAQRVMILKQQMAARN